MGIMTHEEILRDIASLPPEGQRQVIDFIAFVQQRYGRSQSNEQPVSDLRTESFVGIWQDRDDLMDSVDWVRHVRDSEWTK
jgi:hypothetical protein